MVPHNLTIPPTLNLDPACLARFPLTDYFLDESRRLEFGEDPVGLAKFLLVNPYRIHPPHKKGEEVDGLAQWVPGHGLNAKCYGPVRHHEVMAIGKMPYGVESDRATNFIDGAGELLWELTREAGVDTTDWYLTNVVKFGPTGASKKGKAKGFDAWQYKVCIPLLMQEICLVRPRYILLLGADAVKAVIGDKCTLGQVRSQPITMYGLASLRQMHYQVMSAPSELDSSAPEQANEFGYFHALATQHPAAVLHEAGYRHGVVRDLQTFKTTVSNQLDHSSVSERYKIAIVDNAEQLREVVDKVINAAAIDVSLDCEWCGTDYMSGRLRTVQFSWDVNDACVVVFTHQGGTPAQDEFERIKMMNELRRLFNRPGLCLIGHNIRADAPWLKSEGIDVLDGQFFCTMLADHMLNENAEHGLEACTVRYTNMGRYDFDMARWIKENKADVEENGFLNVPNKMLYPYAGCDVIATRRIKIKLQELLDLPENSGLKACYYNVVLPCNLPIHEIETTGLLVDFPLLRQMVERYDTEKIKLLEKLRAMMADPDFNPNSSDQVKRVLFNRTPEQLSQLERAAQLGITISPSDQLVLEQLHPKEDEDEEEIDKTKEEMLLRGTLQLYKPPTKKKEKCYRPGLGLTPYKTTGKPSVMWEDLEPSISVFRRSSPSTDAESLAELSDKHPVVQVLSDYKIVSQITKSFLRKSETDGEDPDDYTTGLGGAIDSDGRIRTNLSQMSETGRQKSYKPNLQNLPKKQEKELDRIFEGKMPHIRSCFVAPDGHVIIEADYKSAEVFSMGYLSNALNLVEDARSDLHARGAVNYFGCPKWDGFDNGIVPPKEWLKEYKAQRVGSKTINFGIPYQRGAKAVARQVTRETKGAIVCTRQMAQDWIDGFYFTYPGMRSYVDMCKQCVGEAPYYLPNPYGRRRRFHPSTDRSIIAAMEREAVNFPIQSVVADTLNVALYNFWYWRKMWPGRAVYKILLAVHDAVLLEVPGEYVGVVVEEVIPQCMTGAALVPSWQPTSYWQPTQPFRLETDIELCLKWGETPNLKDEDSVDKFATELRRRNVSDKWISHFIEE